MIRIYNDDNWQELIRPTSTDDGQPAIRERQTICGSPEARDWGLVPVMDYPDQLLDLADLAEMIGDCHEYGVFARYHRSRARWDAAGWNQERWGYCWAYGIAGSCMDVRAAEAKRMVRLCPHSLGWLVNWRNEGYYLDGAIKGANQRGIASVEYVPEGTTDRSRFKTGWEADALRYRPLEWWDTPQKRSDEEMLRYCATLLATGKPLYIAYYWWSHALIVEGLRYDPKAYLNVVWQLRNSHGEGDLIEIEGSKGVPDECYAVRSMSLEYAGAGRRRAA